MKAVAHRYRCYFPDCEGYFLTLKETTKPVWCLVKNNWDIYKPVKNITTDMEILGAFAKQLPAVTIASSYLLVNTEQHKSTWRTFIKFNVWTLLLKVDTCWLRWNHTNTRLLTCIEMQQLLIFAYCVICELQVETGDTAGDTNLTQHYWL